MFVLYAAEENYLQVKLLIPDSTDTRMWQWDKDLTQNEAVMAETIVSQKVTIWVIKINSKILSETGHLR